MSHFECESKNIRFRLVSQILCAQIEFLVIAVILRSALQLQRFLENCVAPVLTQLDDIQLLPIGAIEFLKDQKVEKLAELDDQYGKILETLIAAAKNGNSFEGDRYRQLRTQLLENTVSYNEALLIDQ